MTSFRQLDFYYHCVQSMFAATAFIYDIFDFVPGLAGQFLDATNQFVFFALAELQVVIRKLSKFLFQFAFGNIPISFRGKSAHIFFLLV